VAGVHTATGGHPEEDCAQVRHQRARAAQSEQLKFRAAHPCAAGHPGPHGEVKNRGPAGKIKLKTLGVQRLQRFLRLPRTGRLLAFKSPSRLCFPSDAAAEVYLYWEG
jgi:hypothetical protein